jgi:hypothetical protein
MGVKHRVVLLTAVIAGTGTVLAGCGGSRPQPAESETPSPVSTDAGSPADQLAGLVAAAVDARYVATYTYTQPGRAPRTITVTLARDGSWLIDVPGAALGGTRDMAVAGTRDGTFQCGLGAHPSCAQVARKGGAVPAKYDPKVEILFTTWIGRLSDRDAPLSVASAPTLRGAGGSCFSVEPTAASLSSPVPSGIYCLATDGTLTGAQLGIGTLTLNGKPTPAPVSITLPCPFTAGGAVPTKSPSPSPSPSGASLSASPSTSPSAA